MAATATKRKDPQLSEEVRELYDKCWKIANESLQKLDIDKRFLQKIKDPYEFSKLMERGTMQKEIADVEVRLNRIFASKNNLPERIADDKKSIRFLSEYIEKNFGKKLSVAIRESPVPATDGMRTIMFPEGDFTLSVIYQIPHEIRHLEEPFSKKINELEALVLPFSKKPDSSANMEFAKLTGVRLEDIDDEFRIQETYGLTRRVVFLVHLYDIGLWKPSDEKTKQNLEFSKILLDKDMRRAYIRYKEGRATLAETDLLNSEDDAVRAYAAVRCLLHISTPTPQVYSEFYKMAAAHSRKIEGFMSYYTLEKKLGEGKLKEFDRMCTEKELVPGIDIDGKLVVIYPKKLKMFEVDMDKLKVGVSSIDELIVE
jgi:hypothetical protein